MSSISNFITFICLGIGSLILAILAVSSKDLLRSTTYLLFVSICTAGFYLLLNYHFLAAIQISVYTGGVMILFIFAIFLINQRKDISAMNRPSKYMLSILPVLVGLFFVAFLLWKHQFDYGTKYFINTNKEINIKIIGETLMGTRKYQYLFPFEAVSLLLLSCVIGGIVIAKKKK